MAFQPLLIGYGEIDPNPYAYNRPPRVDYPAYDIGFFLSGVVVESDLDVTYFSGQLVDSAVWRGERHQKLIDILTNH